MLAYIGIAFHRPALLALMTPNLGSLGTRTCKEADLLAYAQKLEFLGMKSVIEVSSYTILRGLESSTNNKSVSSICSKYLRS